MTRLLFAFALAVATLTWAGCEKGTEINSGQLTFLKSLPGGCNNQTFDQLKNAATEEKDTVVFKFENDSLTMFVGINYVCCAPFSSTASLRNDSLIIRLTDTCNYPGEVCYCKCMCYYTWKFLFAGSEMQNLSYRVSLDDPRQKEPVLISKGFVRF